MQITLKQILEAILFASGKPLPVKNILGMLKSAAEADPENALAADVAKLKEDAVVAELNALREDCIQTGRGFEIVETAGGWQAVSNPVCGLWVRQLFPEAKPARLSPPAMETLAIIAYRQPITRADIEAIRGVAVDGVVQTLLDRGLIRIAGRADIPGRPLLYETTQFFMEHFGLRSLDELPNSSELRKINLPSAKTQESPDSEKKEGKDSSEAASQVEPETVAETPSADASTEEPAPEGESSEQTEATEEPPVSSSNEEPPVAETASADNSPEYHENQEK